MAAKQTTLDGSTVAKDTGRLGGLSLSGHVLFAAPTDATWTELRRWHRLAAEAGVSETHVDGGQGTTDRRGTVAKVIREDIREHGREGYREGADE